MSYISADVMPMIVEFLDMRDRAKMAMVNTGWNQCMYRTNVWKNDRWIPAPGVIGTILHLPPDARHIGSPYKACFFHWLDNQRIIQSKPIKKYYQYWKRIGSPCLYIHHHRFEDTVIASKKFKTLSEKDKQYLFYRCTKLNTDKENSYSAYLRSLIEEFQFIRMNLSRIIQPSFIKSDDVFNVFRDESLLMIQTNEEDAYKYIKDYEYRLKNCNKALAIRGQHQWILNDMAFAKDPMAMWESVAFSLK